MVCESGKPVILPAVHKFLEKLNTSESVGYAATSGEQKLKTVWKKEIIRKNLK